MPFSQEMKELADKIYISELEPIRKRTEMELQQVTRASADRDISSSGVAIGFERISMSFDSSWL